MRAENDVDDASAVTSPRPSWLVWTLASVVGLAGGVLTSYGQTVLGDGWSALANSASPWVMLAFAAGLLAPGRWPTAALAGLLTQVGLVVGYYATTELRGFAAGMAAIVIWVAAGAVAGPVYGAAAALVRFGLPAGAVGGVSATDGAGRADASARATLTAGNGAGRADASATADPAAGRPGGDGVVPVGASATGVGERGRKPGLLPRVCAAGVVGSVWVMEGLNFFSLATDANSNSGPGVGAAWVYTVVGVALPPLIARSARERLLSLLVLAVATGLAVLAGMVINAAFFI